MARLYGAPYACGYRRMGIVSRQDIRRLSQVVAVSPDSGNVLPATVAYGVFLLRETAAMDAPRPWYEMADRTLCRRADALRHTGYQPAQLS